MRPIHWDDHRVEGKVIDLVAAFNALHEGEKLPFPEEATTYLQQLQTLAPMKSRQAAAIAMLEAERRARVGKP